MTKETKKAKKAIEKKASTKKQVKKFTPLSWSEVFASEQLPPLPTPLPKLVETSISQTPDLLKGTVAQVIPVAYSIYPRGLSFVYIDGRTRELRMNCLLVAKEGGGKECITLPIKHILAEVKETSCSPTSRAQDWGRLWRMRRMASSS